MHGGVKVYRGVASAARAYVEADRSRADDYYLAEGTGLARRFGASPEGGVVDLGHLDGEAYELWVSGYDPLTTQPRGRLRDDSKAVRFVEITVNGPKTWSIAAALDPTVSAAYDDAQNRAAEQVIAWVAEHATTRVGPRGRQVQLPVKAIEAVTVQHFTSRAGDPHRHLHLQVNARVFADGKWRGLHTVGFRDSIEALNGIGHAAMITDPGFRAALAEAGFTVDPASGEVVELAPYVGRFSDRAAQITRNVNHYEAEWRAANPGREPGRRLRQTWDRRAWKERRPDKVTPLEGTELIDMWERELRLCGYRRPAPHHRTEAPLRPGALDRQQAVDTVLSRLGVRRSAWNPADVRGEVEKWIAATGLVTHAAIRIELAEDLTARALAVCTHLLPGPNVPEHVRSYSSPNVLAVEANIVTRLAFRAKTNHTPRPLEPEGLDPAQQNAVAALAGAGALVVVEGAAGAGKTTTLRAVREAINEDGHRLLVATPTLKAAQVAAREVGGEAVSVAWLVHQHGYRWDNDGRWTRVDAHADHRALLSPGDLLVVDEAGMLDQDTALALLTIADEADARLALMGDRHQLPAVGRGGVLDLAHRWTRPDAIVSLDVVHRFTDPEYAEITLAMRTGSATYRSLAPRGEEPGERDGEVFGELLAQDQIRIHATEAERVHALAGLSAAPILAGRTDFLTIADTREQVGALNGAVRDRLVAGGHVDDTRALTTVAGERIGVGDRVATRLNDRGLGVANRDTWTVTAIAENGSLVLQGRRPSDLRTVPASYAARDIELAYATTVYGAQGETTGVSHLLLGEHTSAASAYVAMTRGRDNNVAHLVAVDIDHARQQWEATFFRDRADLGPAVAAQRAAEDVERYGPERPRPPAHKSPPPIHRPEPIRPRPEDLSYVRSPSTSRGFGR